MTNEKQFLVTVQEKVIFGSDSFADYAKTTNTTNKMISNAGLYEISFFG
jgi:hypothetical protein